MGIGRRARLSERPRRYVDGEGSNVSTSFVYTPGASTPPEDVFDLLEQQVPAACSSESSIEWTHNGGDTIAGQSTITAPLYTKIFLTEEVQSIRFPCITMKIPSVPMPVFVAPEKVGIFVSYRRADTAGYAGRLVDQLKSRFGDQVFFDVDSIKPGLNFHQVIEDTLGKCGAVVVLIGKKWLERDEAMPRFGDEHDVITQEIRLTMQSKLPIVPVLVDGASMPAESIFPPAFASLSSLNAIDLRHTSFDRDVQALTEQLLDLLGGANETAIERFALKTFGPIFGNSIARISSYFILLAAFGALWGLTELTGAAFLIFQNGIRSLFSASIFDPETARLQAIWMAALGALLFGFLGRRSIRWWRHATIIMWVSLAEIILAVALAAVYVVQVPEARIMDLFDSKKIIAAP